MDEGVARTIDALCRRHQVRLLLIRRPGWQDDVGPRRAFLASTTPSGSWLEQIEFRDCKELTHLDLAAVRSPVPPGVGDPGPGSLHLVCTNGKHDLCCADRGRPVIRALMEAGVPEVWESSHVGGDRFAANVVCLPSGVYFGRVEPEVAVRVLEDFKNGVLHLDHYRGRSCFPPAVQAAEIFARRHLAEVRLGALSVEAVADRGDESEVVFRRHNDERVHVALRRGASAPQRLTCSAEGPSVGRQYTAVSVTFGGV